MGQFPRLPIREKILLSLISVALFTTIVTALSVNTISRNRLVEENIANIQQVSNSEGLAFGELLLQQVRVLESATINPNLSDSAKQQNDSYGDLADSEIIADIEALDQLWPAASEDSELINPNFN